MNDITEQPRRGPGRPPKYHEIAAPIPAEVTGQGLANTAQAVVDNAALARSIRKPFGGLEQKMNYPDRPGFHRHRFNDNPGRIERALEAGYTHVKDKEGNNVKWIVGTAPGGGPQTAYLMEIPEEFFQQDMAAQQQIVNERENAMRRGELEQREGGYVPKQGISIKHGAA